MVATLQWQSSIASSAAFSLVTTIRYKAANDTVVDLNDPLVKPASGVNRSFEKALRINVSNAPTTNLSNLRVLHDRDPIATGVTIFRGFQAPGSYTQPVIANSTIATTGLTTTEVAWANSGTTSSTGAWGDHLYLQLDVDNTASGGLISSWVTIARYDEI